MDISKLIINKEASIMEAMEKLDKGAKRILLVTYEKKLIGVVTDGDIRRWILKNNDISLKVELVMNSKPVVLFENNISNANNIMKSKSIEAIPIVNKSQEVIDIIFLSDGISKVKNIKNSSMPVIIMAGGSGKRLEPYTNIIPKVLIPIGYIPIVERIINNFLSYNFENYYITINYKKEIVKAYFNEERDYSISFVEEEKPLGTAGGLTLLKDKLKGSFFVTNCDILVDTNYSKVVEYHKKNKYKITVISSFKDYIIPYGIFKLNDNGEVKELDEKPKYKFLVNTGMYLLEPDIIKYIPKDTYFDMTDLIRKCIKEGEAVGIYPVTDNEWLDMGEFKSMYNMVEKLNL